MPVRLIMEADYLRIECSGRLTAQDFLQLAEAVIKLEASLGHAPNRITNLTEVQQWDVSFLDIAELTRIRKATLFPNLIKSAVVATLPVHFGMARMFQTLNKHPQIAVEIFSSPEAALEWIVAADQT
ncbi:MAG: hypothetical protein HYV95_03140 [Opitutae bacterium]|nr:hypothetical protein [Opitutae bacterium]